MTDEITALHRDFGSLEQQVKTLTVEVAELRKTVSELNALLNQARGAKWAIFLLPAIVASLVSVFAYAGLKIGFGPIGQ